MKLKCLYLIMTVPIISLSLVACGNMVSKDDYDLLKEDYDSLKDDYDMLVDEHSMCSSESSYSDYDDDSYGSDSGSYDDGFEDGMRSYAEEYCPDEDAISILDSYFTDGSYTFEEAADAFYTLWDSVDH